ncbi:MAG: 50S ribosomal protein L10, partial [Hyphomicrobiales bacterium]|nr:50S ribosomal protein L10 [Hyphomicrobiales bacterium]
MDRSTKEALAQTYREIFAAGGSVVVSEYRGLRVAEMEELRRSMRAAGGAFCVIKNRIAKRALA